VCRHKDGITYHNTVDNLQWGTTKENAEDGVNHGRHKGRVVSDLDMVILRHKHKHGVPLVNLAFDYKISFRQAKNIADGKTKVFRDAIDKLERPRDSTKKG